MARQVAQWWVAVFLCACGSDKEATDAGQTAGANLPDASMADRPDAQQGTGRVEALEGVECDDDDPTTPGSECAGMIACGGTTEAPFGCPSSTHSCCGVGFPSDETVTCYEGANRCLAEESDAPCDGPEDCPGAQICCVSPLPDLVTHCAEDTGCNMAQGFSIFCHDDDDCPQGKSCIAVQSAPFWAFCG